MSYIVRASWRKQPIPIVGSLAKPAFVTAASLILEGEALQYTGTVTISKDGEVIREYKVGDQE